MAYCPRHPEMVARVVCQRCERPICPRCQVNAPVGFVCTECARAQQQRFAPVVSALGFPVKSGAPTITYSLISLSVVLFLAGYVVPAINYVNLGLWPILGLHEPFRLLTHGFLHGSIAHLLMNMYVLWQVGSLLEKLLGTWRFQLLYFGSLLGGAIAVLLLGQPISVHVGASGAIFGLITAYIVIARQLRLNYRPTLIMAGLWLVVGFFLPGISWEGHLGGAIAGGAIILLLIRFSARRPGIR